MSLTNLAGMNEVGRSHVAPQVPLQVSGTLEFVTLTGGTRAAIARGHLFDRLADRLMSPG